MAYLLIIIFDCSLKFFFKKAILIFSKSFENFTGKLSIGTYSLILILISGLLMLYQALKLMRYKDKQNAIRLMYVSIFYLSFIQIIFVIDKFLLQ